MARPYGPSERLRSIAGGALIGLGLHILFGNLDRGAAHCRPGGLASYAGLCLESPGVPAGSRPAVDIILAAAFGYGRNDIVAGRSQG